MPWGDVAFDVDLAASVLGDLVGTPALCTGDVELVKSAGGHAVMIAARTASARSQVNDRRGSASVSRICAALPVFASYGLYSFAMARYTKMYARLAR
jgi:hypothetical protein